MKDLNIIGIGLRCNNVTRDIIDGKETIIMKNDNDGDSIRIEDDKLVYGTSSGIEVFMKSTHPCYKELRDMAISELNKNAISQSDKVLDGNFSIVYAKGSDKITIGSYKVLYTDAIKNAMMEKIPKFKDLMKVFENDMVDDKYIRYKDSSIDIRDNDFIYLEYLNDLFVRGLIIKANGEDNVIVYDVTHTKDEYKIYHKYISNIFIKHLRAEFMKDVDDKGFTFTYKDINYNVTFENGIIDILISDSNSNNYIFTLFEVELFGQYIMSIYRMAKCNSEAIKG